MYIPRKTSEVTLKEAIEELLNTYRLKGKLNEVKVMSAYPKVVGALISKHTLNLQIKDKVLLITVDSAALKNELLFMKEKLLKRLNKVIGSEVVSDIRIL